MKINSIIINLVIILAAASWSVLATSSPQTFGSGANTDNVSKISTILASPDDYLDKDVTIKGTIVKVCKKRGCWMELTSDKKFQTFKVKVRDGDMVFPMTAMGKTAFATGKIQGFPMTLERTKQYLAYQAEEMQESFDPDSVTEAITVYQLAPHGVTIVD
ncbi:DUF4920 domain-containing protein [Psychrosphaera haliotis]|uniref:DUF4920 domain-containing protein n=1 Tax=Psychrosphaera haliotis TaxID=555083 RepID=A0A6N8FDV5_9GAMM|nr:DUF4920 domain-containing protein [Psychrosphaera haliotis]MUH73347.1 DUF4920 domain-containing protein [Psychrosphaera haliotis]